MSPIEKIFDWIERLKFHGLEVVIGRYYGSYDGECTNNVDPKNRGRIMVKCRAAMGDAELGWATPSFMGAGPGWGWFCPPNVGDPVELSFENGDPAKPRYRGGWFGTGEVPEKFAPNGVPTKRGFASPTGHVLRFDDGPEKDAAVLIGTRQNSFVNLAEAIDIVHAGGRALFQMKDGTIKLLDEKGNLISSSASGWTIMSGNTFIVLDGTTTQIVGSNVVISGNVSIGAPSADSPGVRYLEFAQMYLSHTHPTAHGPSGPPLNGAEVVNCKTKSMMVR